MTSQATFDLTLNGKSGFINLQSNGSTIAQITSSGLNSNIISTNVQTTLIQSSAGNGGIANSAGLNIVGYNSSLGASYINFWSSNSTNTALQRMGYCGNGLGWVFENGAGTTVVSFTTSQGVKCDLFTNSNSGNNMTFNVLSTVDAYLYKFAGTSVFSFTNSSGPVLNANSGTIQFSIGGVNYASISTTQITSTKMGSSSSTLTFPSSTAIKCTQLTNTQSVYGANIFSSGNWSSGNYFVLSESTSYGGGVGGIGHWGSTTGSGFASLAPGSAWLPLYFGGSAVQVYYYGGLAVYLNGGGWVNVSDERYKNNIKSLKTESSLKRILALRPCSYKRNFLEKQATVPQELKEKQCIGFIAQEVQNSNPHCVSEVDDQELNEKRLGVNYQDYIVHLCGAVQEQQKQIASQQITINAMADHIKTLTDTLNAVLAKYPI